jgi:hypothetical protein
MSSDLPKEPWKTNIAGELIERVLGTYTSKDLVRPSCIVVKDSKDP